MNRMPYKIKYFFALSLGLARPVFAQLKNPLRSATTFGAVIEKLAQAITYVGIPIAAIFIIYSGFLFVSARGNEEQIKKAKTTFFYTIIGTLLIVGAWAIARALNQFAGSL